jgi:hypothetical protein
MVRRGAGVGKEGGGRGGARMMRGQEEAEGREWNVARV